LEWHYDGVGNRQIEYQGEVATQYTYVTGSDKLSSVGTDSFSSDLNGNITEINSSSIVTEYDYNSDNRLIEVKKNGGSIATYQYDYQGRRIKKVVGGNDVIFIYDLFGNIISEYKKVEAGWNLSEYFYLGSERIARIDSFHTVIARLDWYERPGPRRTMYAGVFIFGFGFVALFGIAYASNGRRKYLILLVISLGLMILVTFGLMAVRPTSVLADSPSGEQVYYYHNDHLGTPVKMTDATGAVVWSADYLPFGQVQIDPASTITNNFRFPGQYYDQETELYYNYHRYYNPVIGRYMTPEPLFDLYPRIFRFLMNSKDLLVCSFSNNVNNVYQYGSNNPIIFIDPLGLWYIDINGSLGYWGGGTGGVMINKEGIYPYVGGGIVSPPGGIAVTWSPSNPTPGWNIGFQGGYWGGGQVGYGFPKDGGKYGEIGFVTPGVSLTPFYVWEPWKWPWKKGKSQQPPYK
jgi:RHS repeat-associated protein